MSHQADKAKQAFWQLPIAALQEQLNSNADGLISQEAAGQFGLRLPDLLYYADSFPVEIDQRAN
jgi:hypothetical protein